MFFLFFNAYDNSHLNQSFCGTNIGSIILSKAVHQNLHFLMCQYQCSLYNHPEQEGR